MKQKSGDVGNFSPAAIVGKSSFFPATLTPKTFWPNLLALKGILTGLAAGQWPFNEFFPEKDLKNLKEFVMKSGLLSTGSLPAGGFEIPPEILKVKDVFPVLALFLAKQALEDTKSHQASKYPPKAVKIIFGMLSENRLIQEFQFEFQRPVWLKALRETGLSEDQISKAGETAARIFSGTAPQAAEEKFGKKMADKFALRYAFEGSREDVNAPLPGTLGILNAAIRELQQGQTDLVITGGIDCINPVFSFLEEISNQTTGRGPNRLREGMGMISLRRFEDAERDGDTVYAVISAIDASSITFLSPVGGNPETHAPSMAFSGYTPPRGDNPRKAMDDSRTGASTPGEQETSSLGPEKISQAVSQKVPATFAEFMNAPESIFSSPLRRIGTLSPQKRHAFFNENRYVRGASISDIGPEQSRLNAREILAISWLPPTLSRLYQVSGTSPEFFRRLIQAEHLSQFARLNPAEILYDSSAELCKNLPFNPVSITIEERDDESIVRGAPSATLDWKKVRANWVKMTGPRRFFHDLLGALVGTFVNRVVLRKPDEFNDVVSHPVIFLANHQIGLESPLFMALSYAVTGIPIQAVAKPEHVNAWLSFLLAFAEDSLGSNQPFRLVYFDRLQPQGLIDFLKKPESQENSLLVHVEGTRAMEAGQPVARISSIFLDMAIQKNVPIIPVRFAGALPQKAIIERLDFPFDNGKQDIFFGGPIFPETLKKMPYGQRPKHVMEQINTLGPLNDEDEPLPSNKEFEAKNKFFMETFGFPKMQAMLFAVLGLIDDPSEETSLLLEAVKSGKTGSGGPAIPAVLKNFLLHMKTKFS